MTIVVGHGGGDDGGSVNLLLGILTVFCLCSVVLCVCVLECACVCVCVCVLVFVSDSRLLLCLLCFALLLGSLTSLLALCFYTDLRRPKCTL